MQCTSVYIEHIICKIDLETKRFHRSLTDPEDSFEIGGGWGWQYNAVLQSTTHVLYNIPKFQCAVRYRTEYYRVHIPLKELSLLCVYVFVLKSTLQFTCEIYVRVRVYVCMHMYTCVHI